MRASREVVNSDTVGMTRILGNFNSEALTAAAATPLRLNGISATRPQTGRLALTVINTSGATLYLGGSNVNATNGYPLASNSTYTADCTGGLYAFSTAGGTVNILEGF